MLALPRHDVQISGLMFTLPKDVVVTEGQGSAAATRRNHLKQTFQEQT